MRQRRPFGHSSKSTLLAKSDWISSFSCGFEQRNPANPKQSNTKAESKLLLPLSSLPKLIRFGRRRAGTNWVSVCATLLQHNHFVAQFDHKWNQSHTAKQFLPPSNKTSIKAAVAGVCPSRTRFVCRTRAAQPSESGSLESALLVEDDGSSVFRRTVKVKWLNSIKATIEFVGTVPKFGRQLDGVLSWDGENLEVVRSCHAIYFNNSTKKFLFGLLPWMYAML